jgi:hypothetical protein
MKISFEHVDSRSELLEQLQASHVSLLIGDDDECAREFFIGAASRCRIGVCSQGHGVIPSGLIDETNMEGWVGYNSKVANVDLRGCHTRFVVVLDWVFYSILSQMADGSVIVVYELGACRISRSGKLIWNCTTDVVTDYSDCGDFVQLQTEAVELRVDKDRGQPFHGERK